MILCPNCRSHKIIKNGKTYYGKQNHKCKCCSRQFVLNNNHTIGESKRLIARRTLLERISLRGMSRLLDVSMSWVVDFAQGVWQEAPDDLGVSPALMKIKSKKQLKLIGLQLDEMWSFVQKKKNKAWIWLVFEPDFNQVLAFEVGSRGKETLDRLWKKIPKRIRKYCFFETDYWEAYQQKIPEAKHLIGKEYTYFIEGFFAGVRARVSRLVRKGLSFSKKLENHIAALKYYFWQYNLEQQLIYE